VTGDVRAETQVVGKVGNWDRRLSEDQDGTKVRKLAESRVLTMMP